MLVAFQLVTDVTAGQTWTWSGSFSLRPDAGSYQSADEVWVDFCYQQLEGPAIPLGSFVSWPLRGSDVVSTIAANGTWVTDITGEYFVGICVNVLTQDPVTIDSLSGWLLRSN